MDMQPNNKKQRELMLYKLLNDILFLWLLVFAGLLALESAVPGFFSAHLSFTKIILVLFAILFSIVWLGKRNGIALEAYGKENIFQNKKILLLLFVSLVLIINSLRNLGLIETAVTSLAIFVVLLFFLKTFFLSEKNS
jgi:hypothetical protein